MTEIANFNLYASHVGENGELIINLPQENWSIVNNTLTIIPPPPPINYITEEEMLGKNFKSSKILECIVKNGEEIISTKCKFRGILFDIWATMSPNDIYDKCKNYCNIVIGEKNKSGFDIIPNKSLSFQNVEANKAFLLIFKMISVTKYSLKMKIEIKYPEKHIVHFLL